MSDSEIEGLIWPLVWSGLNTTLFLVGAFLMVIRREKEPIKSRGWGIQLTGASFAAFHQLMRGMMYVQPFRTSVSCQLFLWPSCLYVAVISGAYVLRGYLLWFKWNMHTYMAGGQTDTHSFFLRYRHTISTKFLICVYVCMIIVHCIPILVLVVIHKPYGDYWDGTCNSGNLQLFVTVDAAMFSFAFGYFVFLLWSVTDIYKLKVEMMLMLAAAIPCIIAFIIVSFLLELRNEYVEMILFPTVTMLPY
eukprot:Lithocolla_globosa_v1_NODE_7210_length_978_cov_2.783315.p1 type:complete len:248 gc:universal NODE_7210_length_978_cov_2.783315:824-81(-)